MVGRKRQESSTARLRSTKESNQENGSRLRKPKTKAPEPSRVDSGYLEEDEQEQQTPKQKSTCADGVQLKASSEPKPTAHAAEPSRQRSATTNLKAVKLAIVPDDLPLKMPCPAAPAAGSRRVAALKEKNGQELEACKDRMQAASDHGSSVAVRVGRSAVSKAAAAATTKVAEAAAATDWTADEPETTAAGDGEQPAVVVKLTYSRENKRLRFSLPDGSTRLSSSSIAAGDASTPAHKGSKPPASAVLNSSSGDVLSPITFSSGSKVGNASSQAIAADSGYASFDGDQSMAEHTSVPSARVKPDSDHERLSAPTNEPSKRRAKQTVRERLREWEEQRRAELEQIEQLELLIE